MLSVVRFRPRRSRILVLKPEAGRLASLDGDASLTSEKRRAAKKSASGLFKAFRSSQELLQSQTRCNEVDDPTLQASLDMTVKHSDARRGR